MRNARLALLPSFAITILAACAPTVSLTPTTTPTTTTTIAIATTTQYTLAVAPKSISVAVPSSLVQSGTTAKSLSSSRAGASSAAGSLNGHDFEGEHMGAYHWVKQGIWDTQKRLARAAWTMVLLDNAISTQSLVPSAIGIKGSKVTWTQAMVDAYTALIPASFAGNANFKSVAKLPVAADQSDLPPFTYDSVPATDTVNYPTYSVVVTFGAVSNGEGSAEETKTLYWSGDKTKFKFDYQKLDGKKVVEQNYVAFDSTKNSMAASRQDVEHGTMTIEIKADTTDATTIANNGAFIYFDASFGKDDADMAFAKDGTVTVSAQGYADKDGGSVTETITVTAGTVITVYYVKEGFDTAGKATFASYSTDGVTYSDLLGSAALVSGYETKRGKAETEHQNLGSTGSEVDDEISKNSVGGITKPVMVEIKNAGITKGVWAAATDPTFATVIGTGTAKQAKEVKIAFTAAPKKGDTYYLAILIPGTGGAAGTTDTANKITLTF
ncbi:MAG: hypothetical protein WCL50_05815 [Spirochaetota bacterium]